MDGEKRGGKVRRARLRYGVSQGELARAFGLSRLWVTHAELGLITITADMEDALAEAARRIGRHKRRFLQPLEDVGGDLRARVLRRKSKPQARAAEESVEART